MNIVHFKSQLNFLRGSSIDKKYLRLCEKINNKGLSMSSTLQKNFLFYVLKNLKKNKITGDIVECGTWQGANIILIRSLIKKKIHVFDTFDGMTEPDKNEYNFAEKKSAKYLLKKDKKKINVNNYHTLSSIETFHQNLKKFNCNKNIVIHKGDVRQTLKKKNNIRKISLLICDTDFYDSSKIVLEKLYSKVANGGIIIFDDYGMWSGQKKAVDNFFKSKKKHIFQIDAYASFMVK